mmetsp:Transcript_21353/g.39764  ORF Transcript_21353/g.39764 Transcript_21353/m.39764 type:complete len:138 (+) Transcript_21353:341-754(+)
MRDGQDLQDGTVSSSGGREKKRVTAAAHLPVHLWAARPSPYRKGSEPGVCLVGAVKQRVEGPVEKRKQVCSQTSEWVLFKYCVQRDVTRYTLAFFCLIRTAYKPTLARTYLWQSIPGFLYQTTRWLPRKLFFCITAT